MKKMKKRGKLQFFIFWEIAIFLEFFSFYYYFLIIFLQFFIICYHFSSIPPLEAKMIKKKEKMKKNEETCNFQKNEKLQFSSSFFHFFSFFFFFFHFFIIFFIFFHFSSFFIIFYHFSIPPLEAKMIKK